MVRRLALVVVVMVLSVTYAGAQEAYCALGQYVWGHATRQFNDEPIPVLLDSLITDAEPLVIGMPGRSVTFMDGSEPTITAGLTASWKAAPLRPESAVTWGRHSCRPSSDAERRRTCVPTQSVGTRRNWGRHLVCHCFDYR